MVIRPKPEAAVRDETGPNKADWSLSCARRELIITRKLIDIGRIT